MSAFLRTEPFKVDIHSLGKRPGNSETLEHQLRIPERIGVELIAVPAATELDLDLQFQSVDGGILLTGSISAVAEAECARCLNIFTSPVQGQFTELFNYESEDKKRQSSHNSVRNNAKNGSKKGNSASSGSSNAAKSNKKIEFIEDEEEYDLHYVRDGIIDIEQTLIDTIALELPLVPLCKADCAGLCVECGIELNTLVHPQEHRHELIDPRFAHVQDVINFSQHHTSEKNTQNSGNYPQDHSRISDN